MAKHTTAWLKRFRDEARTALATRVERNRATLSDYLRPDQWTAECPEVARFLVVFPRAVHHATIQCVLDSGSAGREALALLQEQWKHWKDEVGCMDPEAVENPSQLFNLRKCHAATATLAILTGGDPTPSLEAGGAVFSRFVQWDEDYADMLSGEQKPDDSFLEVVGCEFVRRLLVGDDAWVQGFCEQTLRLDLDRPDTQPVLLLLKLGYLLARERLGSAEPAMRYGAEVMLTAVAMSWLEMLVHTEAWLYDSYDLVLLLAAYDSVVGVEPVRKLALLDGLEPDELIDRAEVIAARSSR